MGVTFPISSPPPFPALRPDPCSCTTVYGRVALTTRDLTVSRDGAKARGGGRWKRETCPTIKSPIRNTPPIARARSPRLSGAGGMNFWAYCDSYSPTRRKDAPSGGVARGAGRRTRRNFTTGPHSRGAARSLSLYDGVWAAVYGADEQFFS